MSCLFDYRSFLTKMVQKVCPGYVEHKDGFNRDNIGTTTFKKGFHPLVTSITRTEIGMACDAVNEIINISLQLYFCSNRDNRDELDAALAKGQCVANAISLRSNFASEGVNRSFVQSITPSFIPTNDNAIIIDLSITMEIPVCLDCCEQNS